MQTLLASPLGKQRLIERKSTSKWPSDWPKELHGLRGHASVAHGQRLIRCSGPITRTLRCEDWAAVRHLFRPYF
jgi:hypothetical protein